MKYYKWFSKHIHVLLRVYLFMLSLIRVTFIRHRAFNGERHLLISTNNNIREHKLQFEWCHSLRVALRTWFWHQYICSNNTQCLLSFYWSYLYIIKRIGKSVKNKVFIVGRDINHRQNREYVEDYLNVRHLLEDRYFPCHYFMTITDEMQMNCLPFTRKGFMSRPVRGNEMKWLIFDEKYISCLKRFRWIHRICRKNI